MTLEDFKKKYDLAMYDFKLNNILREYNVDNGETTFSEGSTSDNLRYTIECCANKIKIGDDTPLAHEVYKKLIDKILLNYSPQLGILFLYLQVPLTRGEKVLLRIFGI